MISTKKLIESLYLENISVEEVDMLAYEWNITSLDLLNILNDNSNKLPVTVEGLIKSMHKFVSEAVQKEVTLNQSIGMIASLRETHESYEAIGNTIKSFIQRVGNIESIKNAEITDFGIYHFTRASILQSQLSDVNSYYNQIN